MIPTQLNKIAASQNLALFSALALGALVLVVPGTGFGMPGHFRISYAVEDWVVDGALAGFARVAEQYR